MFTLFKTWVGRLTRRDVGDFASGSAPYRNGSAIAQFEHSIIVERVNAGLAAARRRGIKLGRPGTLSVHREAVAKLRAQGRTGRSISEELGIPSSSVFKLIAGL